ncbi:hypothetical protein LLH23_00600 [bacterium]|nr:hypothetical protein [bacterium]
MDRARLECCRDNLRALQAAAAAYGVDWDGRLPPRPVEGDWMARRWTASPMRVGLRRLYHVGVAEPGPLWPYLKNACVNRCPSDPDNSTNTYAAGAHGSYVWNTDLSGTPVKDVWPLAWDRAPFHHGARNAVWSDGRLETLGPADFDRLVVHDRQPPQ